MIDLQEHRIGFRLFLANSLLCLSLLMICAAMPVYARNSDELYILTWSGYIDPDVVEQFERDFGIALKFSYFETDELRDDLLVENGPMGFDLILLGDTSIRSYSRRDWLEPLNTKKIPNLKYLDSRWKQQFPQASGYGVPYFWGTSGIAYREDLVSKPINNWMQLLKPDPELRGRIKMVKDSRDLFGVALKALGYSVNSTDKQKLAAAGSLLLNQKPQVKGYSYISSDITSGLLSGDVAAAFAYSGDALQLHEQNPAIRYVIPNEGSNLWMDYWVVMKSSQRKQNAYKFLNYINQPDIAARQAEYLNYASPNLAAEKLLPKAMLENPLIYPGEKMLERCEVYRTLPGMTLRYYNHIFAALLR